jgi:NADH:ubiquinone oxidoreductase subunit 2 (subunit N)
MFLSDFKKLNTLQGEALWRLAHVAVTTSVCRTWYYLNSLKLTSSQWETLMKHRGPYDSCQGVQLVVTALLAQVYGALSKVNQLKIKNLIL